jgi:hypothetical protein
MKRRKPTPRPLSPHPPRYEESSSAAEVLWAVLIVLASAALIAFAAYKAVSDGR